MEIQIKKLDDNAKIPTRANPTDAGYDLYSIESVDILPGHRKLIKTGLSVAIPPGYYGRIAPRSGNAFKGGIDVLAGVIDSSYRGEIGVLLINLSNGGSDQTFSVKVGEKAVAQLIIEKCHSVEWQQVEALPDSSRGEKGYGSSDKK